MNDFNLPTRILYGYGCFSQLEDIVKVYSPTKVLIVTGNKSMQESGYLDQIKGFFDCESRVFEVSIEPTMEVVDIGVEMCEGVDLVVALGGGSVIDAAKAISIISTNEGSVFDYINAGFEPVHPAVPFISVPSTSGTGSEVTKVSVISDVENQVKKSFRSDLMYPLDAVVDPELTLSCSRDVTVNSALDALCHAIESFTSRNSTPLTDPIAFRAVELIHKNLVSAVDNPSEITYREGLSQASLLAGVAISNSGLGMCHGIAHALGFKFNIAHGRACGFLLPESVTYNSSHSEKYDTLAKAVGLETASDLSNYLFELNRSLDLAESLSDFGISIEDIPWISENSFSGSMKANPCEMTVESVEDLLTSML